MNERPPTEILRSGGLEVRPSEFLAFANGRVIMLTQKEQQLLAAMMRNEGRILSRDELYALVWGKKLKPQDRAVDVYVRKLRVRLERELPGWAFIHTHFGFGYRFAAEPSVDANRSVTSA